MIYILVCRYFFFILEENYMNATTFNIIIVLKNNSNKTLAWEQKLRDFIKEKQKNTKNMTIALIEEVSNQLIL